VYWQNIRILFSFFYLSLNNAAFLSFSYIHRLLRRANIDREELTFEADTSASNFSWQRWHHIFNQKYHGKYFESNWLIGSWRELLQYASYIVPLTI